MKNDLTAAVGAHQFGASSPAISRTTHRTLLRIPSWPGRNDPEEMNLELQANDYEVTTVDDRFRVVERGTGQLIYAGFGPVALIEVHSTEFSKTP